MLHSARKAKRARSAVYAERDSNPEFAALWDEAIEVANEFLEVEARRRATEGTIRPILFKGQVAARVREYSDTLLIFLMKAHNAKYRGLDKVMVGGDPGNPVKHEHSVSERIEQLTESLLAEAFADAVDREETGTVRTGDPGESVDPAADQGRADA